MIDNEVIQVGLDMALVNSAIYVRREKKDLVLVFTNKARVAKLDGYIGDLFEIKAFKTPPNVEEKIEILIDFFNNNVPEGTLLIMEGYSFMSKNPKGWVLYEFIGVLKFLVLFKYDLKILAPTTIKKLATGSGRADKQMMFDALPDSYKDEFVKIAAEYKIDVLKAGLVDIIDSFLMSIIST